MDFIGPALNQLMNQVASLRWRTGGEWSCPMTVIAPYGAYLPGGSLWHSESNEGMWAHVHGLNVVIPSTSEDAAALLWSAIHGNDPTLFLVPKHIFRKRSAVLPNLEAVPIGKAAIRRPGTDVTLVTWGNCVELADAAADPLQGEGISVEIIDLRTVHPCDYETIVQSVKHNRAAGRGPRRRPHDRNRAEYYRRNDLGPGPLQPVLLGPATGRAAGHVYRL